MRIECLFLDNGGVITDNSRRGPQYRRLVADYFMPKYGGPREMWEAANVGVWPAVWARFLERVRDWPSCDSVIQESARADADWLRGMFGATGVTPPASDEECAALAREVDCWINPQIDARFPGVDDVVRRLAQRYRLFLASDGFSAPMVDALGDLAPLFERLYGPDLVNVPKSAGRAYYDAIFADAGVDASTALVVDDNRDNVAAATAVGARSVLVSANPASHDGPAIARLAELPALIERL